VEGQVVGGEGGLDRVRLVAPGAEEGEEGQDERETDVLATAQKDGNCDQEC
jgi:hypothetical protein